MAQTQLMYSKRHLAAEIAVLSPTRQALTRPRRHAEIWLTLVQVGSPLNSQLATAEASR